LALLFARLLLLPAGMKPHAKSALGFIDLVAMEYMAPLEQIAAAMASDFEL
jgi:hypothetical protein